MGRTNATYRQHLESFFKQLKPFKNELRSGKTKNFNRLEEKAYRNSHAASQLNSAEPGTPAFLSMILGLQRQLDGLEKRLNEIEESMEGLEDGIQD